MSKGSIASIAILFLAVQTAWAGGGHKGHHHRTHNDSTDPASEAETPATRLDELKEYVCKESADFARLFNEWARYANFSARGSVSWDENLRILANGVGHHFGEFEFTVVHAYGSTEPESSIQVTKDDDAAKIVVSFYVQLAADEKKLLTAVLTPDAKNVWSLNVEKNVYLGKITGDKLLCAAEQAAAKPAAKASTEPKGGPIDLSKMKELEITPEMMNQTRPHNTVQGTSINDNQVPLKTVPIRALKRPNDR